MTYENCVVINRCYDWAVNRVLLPVGLGLLWSLIFAVVLPQMFTPKINLTLTGMWIITVLIGASVRNLLWRGNSKGALSFLVAVLLLVFYVTELSPRVPQIVFAQYSLFSLLFLHFCVNIFNSAPIREYSKSS